MAGVDAAEPDTRRKRAEARGENDVLTEQRPVLKTESEVPADFVLDAALVSRLHCRLTAGDEQLEVEDLSSTNGTFVNNKRIAKGHAADGDRLRIGRVELNVERQRDS